MARIFKWIAVFVVVTACVDPISFDTPPPLELIVVDGSITDAPGPYRVKISRGVDLDADSATHAPVSNVKITLHDDEGSAEDLIEKQPGDYWTTGTIQGRVGHSYHITMEMPDGEKFESVPETILPGGEVKTIRYEFDERTTETTYGEFAANVYNIYVDADAPSAANEQVYIRWRFKGTYKVQTNPELHRTNGQGFWYMTPYACSGYTVEPAPGGGRLVQKTECTCCTCWVNQFEPRPQISSAASVVDGKFRNIKVGEVPITNATFFEKYRIDIDQLRISKTAYDFFRIVTAQKDGSTNLFQPPSGRLVGNIRPSGAGYPVIGLFWAASVHNKTHFIHRSEVPYPLTPIMLVPEPCYNGYANATTVKPEGWDE